MNMAKRFAILLLAIFAVGCAAKKTFHELAFAGDTVAVASGWMHTFDQDNITVEIYASDWDPVTNPDPFVVYPPNDPHVRAVVNMYLDPLSSLVVSRETDQDLTLSARTYASTMKQFTGKDKDWWQTVVFVDLPDDLIPGTTYVEILTPEGEFVSTRLEIVAGTGTPHDFEAQLLGPMYPEHLASLGRVDHKTVTFSSGNGEIPYAIQIDLTHAADANNSGSGYAYVVNPIGYIKNASWSDDGFKTRVILTPTQEAQIKAMEDFKFYVAGGIQDLAVDTVVAYDINGEEVLDDDGLKTIDADVQ